MPKAPQLEMNWLDRAIGYVAPIWGARRMQSRYTMAAAQYMASGLVTGVRRLAGSGEGTLGNWNPRREQRLAENRSFDTIMARAESLVANDGHAASSVSSLALNVAGPGLRPQSYPEHAVLGITEDQAEAFADSAEAAWSLWCKEAHAGDTLTFDDLQYQAVHSMFVTGEFLHLPVWLDEPGRTFGLAIQDLHPARLRTPSDLQQRADVRCGVHLGRYNRPLGYFIASPSDNTSSLSSLTSDHFTYVPRKIGHRYACLHRFHSDMPEQIRGVTILSPAMKLFRDLSDYVDYELVGALIAASFTVFIEAPGEVLAGMGSLDGKSAAGPVAAYPPQLQPGTLTTGQAGHKPHIISSARPGPTFDAFYERILRAAAASTGQPYEMVAKDFSKTNYSSARAALLEVWKMHTLYQEWFVRGNLNPIWGMVMEEAWLRGLLAVPAGAPSIYDSPRMAQAWLSCVWTRPPRGQIDQVKEREAESRGLESLTETRTAICHSRGLDFETIARTRQREEKLLKKLGLQPTPTAPGKPKETDTSDDEDSERDQQHDGDDAAVAVSPLGGLTDSDSDFSAPRSE
ncbi:phage portal protein [Desulfovibrio sp. 86]|uniref:Lambda family phage portal protein n=1 Tax=uncultured Desulfovibrio sp. TaxID=167968 RepID=A0A212KXL9_9BACT|nr:phage portal protein [Desulfovibrio sp. 86]SCM70010.1 Lambda family phage portal protein [uncultured Desulfovibrio sp.]VZH35343.1 Lambda family phage portal protein [Desulfovibrio sp. 86]